MLARAEEVGNRRLLSLCYHALGAVQYLRGQWADSMAALSRSVELARGFGGTFGEVLGEQRLGVLETGMGRYEEAHERLSRALAVARQSRSPMVRGHSLGRILSTLAHNRAEAGDLAGATEYLAQGLAMQRRVGDCPSCDVLLYPAAVPIYLRLGELDQADQACRKAEETALAFGSQAWTAAARYLRGLLDTARGQWHPAADRLQSAAERFEALGQPYELARCLDALAELAHSAGPHLPDLSAAVLQERASQLYTRLGAVERIGRTANTNSTP